MCGDIIGTNLSWVWCGYKGRSWLWWVLLMGHFQSTVSGPCPLIAEEDVAIHICDFWTRNL